MGKDDSDIARDGTLGHQFNKRLQSLLLAGKPCSPLVLKSLQKSAKQENSSLFMDSIL
jgi:hypothetical protein